MLYSQARIGNVSNLIVALVSSPREVAGALGGAGFFTGMTATGRGKTVVSSHERMD
jgi:hypothetical protein